jgi:hypothetical protein
MSHFTVVVCIDNPERLNDVMAPWDENREVEPYRSYEAGGPADYWLYSSLKRAAEDYAAGTGLKPYKPDEIGWSTAYSKDPPEKQRAEQKADAELFWTLPIPVTWADIARLHHERYDDSEPLLVSEDGLRGYTMSTYNPESRWDYWRIGGRWGGYFRYREGCRKNVLLPEHGWDSPKDIAPHGCNGGQKRHLDLDALRADKAESARKLYREWQELVAGTPDALPWSSFTENISEGNGYDISRAREEYHSQPRVQAYQETDFRWHDDPIAEFSVSEDLYVEREGRARAVPGYATVTTDGRWMAPGKMGWFGAHSDSEGDRIGYWEAANAYIDGLDDEIYLIALDCHI